MVDELKIHIKNRDFHALSQLLQRTQPFGAEPANSDAQSLAHPDVLLEELEIQIEDLKNEGSGGLTRKNLLIVLRHSSFFSK